MTSLAALLRSAGEEEKHDWKKDLDKPDTVSRKEGRTKLVRMEWGGLSGARKASPKTETVRLSKVDFEVVKGLARGEHTIRRPTAATKKNFKRDHPEIRFISDMRAIRYMVCKKPGETYDDFQNRQPERVKITPIGRHFRAELNPKTAARLGSFQPRASKQS